MNILVMMLHWYPHQGPLQPIYKEIFTDLMARGHKITIVTSFPHYRRGSPETWAEYRGKVFEVSDWQGARLVRSYVFAPVFDQNRPGLFHRGLNYLSFNISSIFAGILFCRRPDVVFALSSPPLSNGICAWLVSLWKRCPVVYGVQDMYPDMAEKLSLVRNGCALAGLKALEKIAYAISDKIVVPSEALRYNIQSKGVPADKTFVIPNCIDTDFIKPLPQSNPFSQRWGLTNRFVVMYAGNIGLPHGVEVIIHAAKLLSHEKEVIFCFVARGEHKDKVKALAKSERLANVTFIPTQPERVVPYVWASASLCVVSYRRGLSEDLFPSKLLAIMSSGRPVIAAVDEHSEASRIIEDSGCGMCVTPEDPGALAEAIHYLYLNKEVRKKMGALGRDYVIRHFKQDVTASQYEKLFLSLFPKSFRRIIPS